MRRSKSNSRSSKNSSKSNASNDDDSDGDGDSELCVNNDNQELFSNQLHRTNAQGVNNKRPVDFIIPCASELESLPSLPFETYAPQYYHISRVNDTPFRPVNVFYDESLFDGTISKIKPPSPLVPTLLNPPNNTSSSTSTSSPPLSFYSNFESGNLLQADRVGVLEYDLVLRADVHTAGYSQWFYFAVTLPSVIENVTPGGTLAIRFNIINLVKPESLFSEGMRPIMFDCAKKKEGWRRVGSGIRYQRNHFPKMDGRGKGRGDGVFDTHLSLSFTVDFPLNSGKTFLLAHHYPYTYSDHQRHIESIMANPERNGNMRRAILCLTLGKRQCDLLTITNFNVSSAEMAERSGIVLTGRVHPGESGASWVMRGLINYLTGNSEGAVRLRNKYVFKVVPMLNPDGVALGNNRCNLAGVDLNRQWNFPDAKLHTTIDSTKKMIKGMQTMRNVILFIDIHNHSRKKWAFFYGVADPCYGGKKFRLRNSNLVKDFIRRTSSTPGGKHFFNYSECNFVATKDRDGTARVVMARELNIALSFTLEISFCGATGGVFSSSHYNIRALLGMGKHLFDGISESFENFNVNDYIAVPTKPANENNMFHVSNNIIHTSNNRLLQSSSQQYRRKTSKESLLPQQQDSENNSMKNDLPIIKTMRRLHTSGSSRVITAKGFTNKEEESSLLAAEARWRPPPNEEEEENEEKFGNENDKEGRREEEADNNNEKDKLEEEKKCCKEEGEEKEGGIVEEEDEVIVKKSVEDENLRLNNKGKRSLIASESCIVALEKELEQDNHQLLNPVVHFVGGSSTSMGYYWSQNKKNEGSNSRSTLSKEWKPNKSYSKPSESTISFYSSTQNYSVSSSPVLVPKTYFNYRDNFNNNRPLTSSVSQYYLNPYIAPKKIRSSSNDSTLFPFSVSNNNMLPSLFNSQLFK